MATEVTPNKGARERLNRGEARERILCISGKPVRFFWLRRYQLPRLDECRGSQPVGHSLPLWLEAGGAVGNLRAARGVAD